MSWGQDVFRKISFIEEEDLVVSAKVKYIGVSWVIADIVDMCLLFTIKIAYNTFSPVVD